MSTNTEKRRTAAKNKSSTRILKTQRPRNEDSKKRRTVFHRTHSNQKRKAVTNTQTHSNRKAERRYQTNTKHMTKQKTKSGTPLLNNNHTQQSKAEIRYDSRLYKQNKVAADRCQTHTLACCKTNRKKRRTAVKRTHTRMLKKRMARSGGPLSPIFMHGATANPQSPSQKSSSPAEPL